MNNRHRSQSRGLSASFAFCLIGLACVGQAAAQSEVEPEDESEVVYDTIVVTGQRLRGQVLSPERPDLIFTESDIAAYGVSSLGELLQIISAETSSNRGRRNEPPVVLLNGRRVSGFREIGRYPVEAVSRVEVLSETVSLSYGFAANQRVINFVLKDDVTILALETGLRFPESGGSTESSGEAQRLFIDGDTRFAMDLSFKDRPSIKEGERSVSNAAGGLGLDRTILSDNQSWSLGSSYARAVPGNAIATLSGSFDRDTDELILDEFETAQLIDTEKLDLGLTINGPLAPTTWTLTGKFEREVTSNQIGNADDPDALQDSKQTNTDVSLNGILNFRPHDLSGGPLTVTLDGGFETNSQQTDERLPGVNLTSKVTRDTAQVGINIDSPFRNLLMLPGDFIINTNVDHRELSDIGGLTTYGAGGVWRISDKLQLDISATREEEAPTLEQLSGINVTTPRVRVLDLASGATTQATTIDGGNLNLISDFRNVLQMGIQFLPLGNDELKLNVDYTSSQIENEARQFSLVTPTFEAAFPERVIRDNSGQIIQFDRRPVQTDSTTRKNLRTNISWSQRIEAERKRATGPRPKKRLKSGRPGSLRISATHNWTLEDKINLIENGPTLDFLKGDALDLRGGTPEHFFDLTAYRWNNGLGTFLSASYRSPTRIEQGMIDYNFGAHVLVNARLSYEFNYADTLVTRWPLLEETRILFGVENLFDDVSEVQDANGNTPTALQRDLIDPLGRTFRFELRKRF